MNKPALKEYDEFIIVEENKKKGKRFGFGVELASVSNYSADGASDGVNFGGGMSATYQISSKVSFATGAVIAKQSVNYVGERQNEMAYADLNSAFADNTLSNIENMTSSDSEISFVTIDIPLNVRFNGISIVTNEISIKSDI